MLDDLISHFIKSSNKSFLARIYGVFTLRTNVFRDLDVILMQNIKRLENPKSSKTVFDLKGSLVNRYVSLDEEEKQLQKETLNSKRILKDLNFMEIEASFDQRYVLF